MPTSAVGAWMWPLQSRATGVGSRAASVNRAWTGPVGRSISPRSAASFHIASVRVSPIFAFDSGSERHAVELRVPHESVTTGVGSRWPISPLNATSLRVTPELCRDPGWRPEVSLRPWLEVGVGSSGGSPWNRLSSPNSARSATTAPNAGCTRAISPGLLRTSRAPTFGVGRSGSSFSTRSATTAPNAGVRRAISPGELRTFRAPTFGVGNRTYCSSPCWLTTNSGSGSSAVGASRSAASLSMSRARLRFL